MKVEVTREYVDPSRMDMPYDYPVKGLKPGDELHEFLVEYVRERVLAGRSVVDGHKDEWKEMEWTQQAFVPEKDAKKCRGRNKKKNPSESLNIHVPLSFSALDQACAYHHSVFLSQPPIHRYTSDAGALGKISAGLHERAQMKIDLQMGNILALDGQLRDGYLYGGGYCSLEWHKRRGNVPYTEKVDAITQAVMLAQEGVEIDLDTIVKQIDEGKVVAEGTKDRNLDPWKVIRDPSVTVNDIQESEFFGFVNSHQNAMMILSKESDPEERRFNGIAVKMLSENGFGCSDWWFGDESGHDARSMGISYERFGTYTGNGISHRVDECTLFIRLIPAETGTERQKLGGSKRVETWVMSVACDRIVTQCHKLELQHGRIPATALSPMNAVHDVVPISHMAITYPFQKYLDLRMNASARNTLKTANNTTIVNPWLLEMDTVLNSQEGGIWMMTEMAMEMDAGKVAYQMPVQDLSPATLNETAAITSMCRDGLGISEATSGDLSSVLNERPGQAGVNAAISGSYSRMERAARIMDAQCFQERGRMVAWNNIQLLDTPVWVKLTGQYRELLKNTLGIHDDSIQVNKDMLDPDFDVVPSTGKLSSKNDPTPVNQIFQMLLGVPGMAQEIVTRMPNSIMAIFFQWCLRNGFEDISEIEEAAQNMTVTVGSEESLQQGQDNGNMIDAREAFGNG